MASFQCPHCGRQYDYRDGLAGRKVRCAGCNASFVIAAPATAASPTAPFNPTAQSSPTAYSNPTGSPTQLSSVQPSSVQFGVGSMPQVAPSARPWAAPVQGQVLQGIPVGIPVGVPVPSHIATPMGFPSAVGANASNAVPLGIVVGTPFGMPGYPAAPVGFGVGVPANNPPAFPTSPLGQSGLDRLLAADAGAVGQLGTPAAGPFCAMQPIRYRRKANIPWKWIVGGTGAAAAVGLLIYVGSLVVAGISNATSGGGGMFAASSSSTQEADQTMREYGRILTEIASVSEGIHDPQTMQQAIVRFRRLNDECEVVVRHMLELDRGRIIPSQKALNEFNEVRRSIKPRNANASAHIQSIPGIEQLQAELQRYFATIEPLKHLKHWP